MGPLCKQQKQSKGDSFHVHLTFKMLWGKLAEPRAMFHHENSSVVATALTPVLDIPVSLPPFSFLYICFHYTSSLNSMFFITLENITETEMGREVIRDGKVRGNLMSRSSALKAFEC